MNRVDVTDSDCRMLPLPGALPPLDPRDLERHKPDAHWALAGSDEMSGRCSLWWQGTPRYGNHRVGVIGHYAAGGNIVAEAILQHACRLLAENGCTIAIGPMDGNTWRHYRLITEFGSEPRFFLEPDHPSAWPRQFVDAGFEPLARYFSALNSDLARQDPRVAAMAERARALGIRVRSLAVDDFDAELRGLFAVARAAFRDHLLYAPIDEQEFLDQYRPLRGAVPTDLVLIAEHAGRPVGFVFAVPDMLEQRRGATSNTLIVKTLAVLPERQYAGLGQWLLANVQQQALRMGFDRAIHALVRDVPHLRRISARYAMPIRQYTLFAKILQP